MKNKDIKYIALDLDGTLTNEDKIITPITLNTLLSIQKKGIRLILASGRPPYGMRPLAKLLHMADYDGLLLCYNGGHIEEVKSGKVLYERQLPDEYIPQLHKWQEESGMTLMSYYEDHIYTEHPNDRYVLQSSKNNNMSIVSLNDFIEEMPRPINKCLMVGDPSIVPEWEGRMRNAMRGKMNVCHSTPYFIELLPTGIDKGIALSQLMDQLGFSLDNVMSFGDSYNDLGMIKMSGIGVAMGNAEDEIKQVADYITLSNEEDGVAHALSELI